MSSQPALRSIDVLRSEYPQLYNACVTSYWSPAAFGRTYDGSCNDAGFMLSAADRASVAAVNELGHRGVDQAAVDRCLAAEIRYHWKRQRQFRHAAAALARCLCNLVSERPLLFVQAVRGGGNANAGTSADHSQVVAGYRRGHVVGAADMSVLQDRIRATGTARSHRRTGVERS